MRIPNCGLETQNITTNYLIIDIDNNTFKISTHCAAFATENEVNLSQL